MGRHHVRRFAAFLGRPPDTATAEDLRNFQIHQYLCGASPMTINSAVSALRFPCTVTLHPPGLKGLTLTAGAGLLHTRLASFASSNGYWVINGRISLVRDGDWDVAVWGKNLADKRYVVQGINQLVLGFGYRVYGTPRTFGISFTKNFK